MPLTSITESEDWRMRLEIRARVMLAALLACVLAACLMCGCSTSSHSTQLSSGVDVSQQLPGTTGDSSSTGSGEEDGAEDTSSGLDQDGSADRTDSDDANSEEGSIPAVKADPKDAVPAVKASDASADASEAGKNASESTPGSNGDFSASTLSVTSELVVRFIDVGQGDCALISSGGQHMMIDGGPSSASSKVYSILKTLGIDRLDHLVVTHPDADHCGGVSGALEYATCSAFYCSTTTHDTKTWNSLKTRLDKQGVDITVPATGDSFTLGDATVTFIAPVTKGDSDNNNSLVLRIDHGTRSFLFAGDAEASEEISMLTYGGDIDVDVLKVGHHGSAGSSSAAFLAKVTPEYSIVSVGKNSYGHPTQQALERLESCGSEIYRTDELGSIVATSNGDTIEFEFVKGRLEK